MADEKLQQKLVDYIEDAHAMEQNVSTMLTSMISTTDDPEIKEMLEHHKEETERQEARLRERLDAQAGADCGCCPGEGCDRCGAWGPSGQERQGRLHHRAHGNSRLPAPRAPGTEGRGHRDCGGGPPEQGRRGGDGPEVRRQLGPLLGPHASRERHKGLKL